MIHKEERAYLKAKLASEFYIIEYLKETGKDYHRDLYRFFAKVAIENERKIMIDRPWLTKMGYIINLRKIANEICEFYEKGKFTLKEAHDEIERIIADAEGV